VRNRHLAGVLDPEMPQSADALNRYQIASARTRIP
jgi:hypothetical protein